MATSTCPAAWASSSSSVIAARVAAFVEVGFGGHGLHQRAAVRRAVGVEVVEYDEPGAGARRSGEDTALQRRELLVPPLVVPRVEAEVDDVGAGADAGGERRVGGVAADDLGAGEVGRGRCG